MRVVIKIIFLILYSKLSFSQTEVIPKVVISPNKVLTEIDKTGSSIIFIDEYDIEKSASNNISQLLQEYSSFTVANKGGLGADPSYHNRGLSRKYIKVLIDGMDISDITAPQEEPTYINNINLYDMQSIEILNGSQGTLYGSNAVGGVISFQSAQPISNGIDGNFYIETGTYGTVKVGNSLSYLANRLNFKLSLNGERSNGFSSLNNDTNSVPLEKDGYQLLNGKALVNFKLNKSTALKLVLRNNYHENEFDDVYDSPSDTTTTVGRIRQFSGLISISHKNNNIHHKITVQPSQSSRINTSPSTYEYDSLRNSIEYLFNININQYISILTGLNYTKLSADMTGELSKKETKAIFSEFRLSPINNLNFDVSVRKEYDGNYDEFDTGRIQLKYNLSKHIAFKSSTGTGYRSPGMYELYSGDYGNKKLTPEKSIASDISLNISIPLNNTKISLGAFLNDVSDKIEFATNTYVNTIGKTKIKGYEGNINFDLSEKISFNSIYSQTNGKDNKGNRLKLVPKHKLISSLNYQHDNKLSINLYNQYYNRANDTSYKELPNFRSINFRTNYKLNNDSLFYLKIENISDRTNVVNRGYTSPQKSVYFGIKKSLL